MENILEKKVSEIFDKYFGQEHLLYGELKNISINPPETVKNIAIYYPGMSIGGAERVISLQVLEFLKLGYGVTLLLDEGNERYIAYPIPDNVKVIFIPSVSEVIRSKSYLSREKKLNEIMENEHIDLFCHQYPTLRIALYDMLTVKKHNVFLLLLHHELFSQHFSYLSNIPYRQRHEDQLADGVVVLTKIEQLYCEILGINATYIPNPLGGYAVSAAPYNFQGDIVWGGRLENLQKQFMDIVPIMKEVVRFLPNVKIRVYGPEWHTGNLKRFECAVKENNLEDHIIYCGCVSEGASQMYENASVHLVTSAFESFGMAIAEGKMNGIPLVLYDMPYLELLQDKKGYIAVEPDNPRAAAEAIVRILTDQTLAERLSREAKQSVQKFIDFDYGAAWKKFITDLTDKDSVVEKLPPDREKLEMILDTLGYHYFKGVTSWLGEFRRESQKAGRRPYIKRLLQICLHDKKDNIVIYTYGVRGKEVKDILNHDLGIQEAFILDNKLAQEYEEIKELKDLKTLECAQYQFILCSSKAAIHEELLTSLRAYVPEENIIDLFG